MHATVGQQADEVQGVGGKRGLDVGPPLPRKQAAGAERVVHQRGALVDELARAQRVVPHLQEKGRGVVGG